jgi:putative phosphoesterase
MKIGLISDIHADLKGLQIALDILQGQQVDRIICCGDLVDKGLEGDAVVQLIRERKIPVVMGNHDYLAHADRRSFGENYRSLHPLPLSEETLAYLYQLPARLEFMWEEKQLLLAHGIPQNWDSYLYSFSPRSRLEQVFTSSGIDIVILGHTHEPMMVSINNRWIFNPGSVYRTQSEGSGTCATLSLPDLEFHVFSLRDGTRVQPDYRHFE